ncbi:MAG TPA: PLP-dependent transferase [Bacteroidales bacterium]|nr:PLP-dependent transferase [Bacteroidales bacterium]
MKRKEINSSRLPVYRDAGFELYNAETTADAFKKETENLREPELYIYSRYRNPNVVSAEDEIMALEESSWAILTQSGMSAIDTILSVFQHGREVRPWLFFTEIYGGTISYIDSVLKRRRGLDIHSFTPEDGKYNLSLLDNEMEKLRPELVYIESVSNPMLIVPDVRRVVEIAHKYGSRVIIDNTFATPWLYKPLRDGVDAVIHSVTKYFSGHGNLTAGVICGNDTGLLKQALEYRKFVGHMLSPDDAYRLQTQIQSFELRFERQCNNAAKLAAFLDNDTSIAKVWFPGLESHATHDEAKMLFADKGWGAMITFDFSGKDGDEKRRRRDIFIEKVSPAIKLIPTLGDSRTILMPVEAVWGEKYQEPGMIRLSVGFENYEDIERVFRSALAVMEAL